MTIPIAGRYRLRGGRQRFMLRSSRVVGAIVAACMFINGLTMLQSNDRPEGVLSVFGVTFVSLLAGGLFAGVGLLGRCSAQADHVALPITTL